MIAAGRRKDQEVEETADLRDDLEQIKRLGEYR